MSAIKNGDEEAEKIWLKSIEDLATAICSFSNILDPEAIIIGGGIANAGDRLFKPLRDFLDPILWQTDDYELKLIPAELGDLAGAYGAAAHTIGILDSK
jgi:glucokinase